MIRKIDGCKRSLLYAKMWNTSGLCVHGEAKVQICVSVLLHKRFAFGLLLRLMTTIWRNFYVKDLFAP
jgi:hypothetical protein